VTHRGIVIASASIAAGAGAPAAAGVLPLIVAVIAVIVAACGGAILLASLLRLDQRWPWAAPAAGGRRAGRPEDVVREVVRCAEQAQRSGAASITTLSTTPGLRRGLRLIADGASPETVRQTLERELDRDLERRARGGPAAALRDCGAAPLAGVGLIVAGVAMLGGAVWGAGTIAAGAAMTALLLGLALLSLRTPSPDALAQREAAEVLTRTLVIRGVSMIAAGAGAREVEQHLRSLLPPTPTPPATQHTRQAA